MPKKTNAVLCFEKYISDSKLEKPWKDTILYAKSRWEFIRRNKVFREDLIKKREEEHGGLVEMTPDMPKWNMKSVYSYSLEDSFEEIIHSEAKVYKERLLQGDEWSYHYSICSFTQNVLPVNPIVSMLSTPEESLTSNNLKICINLTFSKSKIMDEVEIYVRAHQRIPINKIKPKKTRVKHRYDLYPDYLAVYDMRENDKLTYREIAKVIIPNDLETDQKAAEVKLIQWYKEAKRLVEQVAAF